MDPARRQFEFMNAKIKEAEATAARRLALLRECEWGGHYAVTSPHCSICKMPDWKGHADDCELAKELADADS
jgi:hypothetical protein